MTKFRRLDAVKPFRHVAEDTRPVLRLMGLEKRKEGSKDSAQLKLSDAAMSLLDVVKGSRVSIIDDGENNFYIAKVNGEDEGRAISDANTFTFGPAYSTMKPVATEFLVTDEFITAGNDEERESLGDYKWYILKPVANSGIDSEVESVNAETSEKENFS